MSGFWIPQVKLGLAVAEAWNIMNNHRIIVGSGRRHTGTSYAYQSLHTAWWIDPDDIHFSSSGRADSVDLMKIGVPIDNIHAVRYIVILEGKPDDRPLLELLEQSKALGLQEELQIPEGRVRLQTEEQQFEQQDDNESVSSRRLSDFESDVFAMLHCQRLKDLTNCKHLPEDKPLENFSKHLPLLPYAHCFHAQEDDTQELWYKMSGLCPGFYPLKKDARPMTKQELTDNKIEVRQAKLKELSSWVKQSAGKPKLRSEYRQRTNLDPIPSRWVEVWKFKQGKRIIRIRLVLKGFAERNQETLQTSSPTSSRIGHRLIYSKAAQEGWEI